MYIHVVNGEAHECSPLAAVLECDSKEVKAAYQLGQMTTELWESIGVYEVPLADFDNQPDHDPWTQRVVVGYEQVNGTWTTVFLVEDRSAEEVAELAEMRKISEVNDLLDD